MAEAVVGSSARAMLAMLRADFLARGAGQQVAQRPAVASPSSARAATGKGGCSRRAGPPEGGGEGHRRARGSGPGRRHIAALARRQARQLLQRAQLVVEGAAHALGALACHRWHALGLRTKPLLLQLQVGRGTGGARLQVLRGLGEAGGHRAELARTSWETPETLARISSSARAAWPSVWARSRSSSAAAAMGVGAGRCSVRCGRAARYRRPARLE